jgi:hypothetical protein
MSDQLDDFIKANRSAFDDKEPPEHVWRKIKETLPGTSVPWYNSLALWRAAAMIFLVLSIYLLIPKDLKIAETNSVALNEFNDVETFYNSQISQKVALIEEFSGSTSTEEFTQDFQQLEAMYNVLKEEWKARPSKKVKDALVLNLLVRINLLNQQLHRLEKDLKTDEPASRQPTSEI